MTRTIGQQQAYSGYLGVDTGGTFTDFYYEANGVARIHKVLSTPDAPERAILQGIDDLGIAADVAAGSVAIVHGSTVATNAALERKGVKTVYVTNKGFADTLSLARQNRTDIYALHPRNTPPPVPREYCLEVPCRRGADGKIVTPLTIADIDLLKAQIDAIAPVAVAINLLFSYLNSEEEQRIAAQLKDSYFVCCSSDVLPEYREYERGMATWLNAWLGPKVAEYLTRLREAVAPSPVAVMQSSGGTMAAEQASRYAVNMLLSGPAGGLAAAKAIAGQLGNRPMMTFDMGGTSTDVALIDGEIRLTSESRLAEYPVAVPMVDMHTIGAGGGSLAYVDGGGLLHVGPESAGASPGPACYGLGGKKATVTDANAVLGRLRPDYFLGGKMPLDLAAAQAAIGELAESLRLDILTAAQGVIALANEHMAAALRLISIQKGFDPQAFELCCFGGAGGLHVCALAEALAMTRIVVPANGGVLSAQGMLLAPRQRNLSRSVLGPLVASALDSINALAKDLQREGLKQLAAEGVDGGVSTTTSLDCRYLGQSFTIAIPLGETITEMTADFHQKHNAQYGHKMALPLELVNVRVRLEGAPALVLANNAMAVSELSAEPQVIELPELGRTAVWQRSELIPGQMIHGPAIICEEVSTTLVGPNWFAYLDEFKHLRMALTQSDA